MTEWDAHVSPRPCGLKNCPHPARTIDGPSLGGNLGQGQFCGEHEHQEQPPPEAVAVHGLDPVDELKLQQRTDRVDRTDRLIRAALATKDPRT
jgi:hypothetical protein